MANPLFVLKTKLFPPQQITATFEGKTVIVTGTNTGVGYATALKYVQLAASTVILGVRSLENGEIAKARIEKATGRSGIVQVWQLDMSSFGSIDAFGRRAASLGKLDIAILNAGLLNTTFTLSATGWENNLQVNTLGTALLAILLAPKLQSSRSAGTLAHLVVVRSTAHINMQLRSHDKNQLLHKYNSDLGIGSFQQHATSKLLMMWVTRELAYRCINAIGKPTVIVNDVCPGGCQSDALRDFNTTLWSILKNIGSFLLLRPAENGARVVVGASTLGEDSHGRWWGADGNYGV